MLIKYNILQWFHVCTIEELIYLTRNGDNSVEVSRRGTPLFFKFKTEEQLSTFISICDGYYRFVKPFVTTVFRKNILIPFTLVFDYIKVCCRRSLSFFN